MVRRRQETVSHKMRNIISHIFSLGGAIFLIVLVGRTYHSIFHVLGAEPPETVTYLLRIILVFVLLAWFWLDKKRDNFKDIPDLGLFILLAWPVFLPYYVVKTRKAKGLFILAGLISVWLVGIFFGVVLGRWLKP